MYVLLIFISELSILFTYFISCLYLVLFEHMLYYAYLDQLQDRWTEQKFLRFEKFLGLEMLRGDLYYSNYYIMYYISKRGITERMGTKMWRGKKFNINDII